MESSRDNLKECVHDKGRAFKKRANLKITTWEMCVIEQMMVPLARQKHHFFSSLAEFSLKFVIIEIMNNTSD